MGGGAGGTLPKERPFQMARGGACPPLNSPPVWGGALRSPPQAEIFGNLARNSCVLTGILRSPKKSECSPPEWGGERGGLFCGVGGERGGALPPYSDRASYVPRINHSATLITTKTLFRGCKSFIFLHFSELAFRKFSKLAFRNFPN